MEEVKEMLVWEVTWYRAMNDEVRDIERTRGREEYYPTGEVCAKARKCERERRRKKKKDTCMVLLKHGSKFFDILPMDRWKSMFHLS